MSIEVANTSDSVSSAWSRQQLRPAVWLNLSANHGEARSRWRRIESEVMLQLPHGTPVYAYEPPFDMKSSVEAAVRSGVNCPISAGGDGTMNVLLNALIDSSSEQSLQYTLGGIGLGSSNDFVKPVRNAIGGCPTRLNPEGMAAADIARVDFLNPEGHEEARRFVLNASMGVTANANHLFNRGDQFLDFLKPRSVAASILYAAVRAIAAHRSFPVDLEIDGRRYCVQLSNLAILKSPHVSGTLRYEKQVSADDGFLAVNYCDGMSRLELLRTLSDLRRGRFIGPPKRVFHRAREVHLQTSVPVALEMDGEVFTVTRCSVRVLPSRIRFLGC